MKNKINSNLLVDGFYITTGALVCGFALKSFLVPAHFLDGGVTGISLLLHEVYGWNIAVLIILSNLPFIFIGARQINKAFAYRSLLATILLALCLNFLPYPEFHYDKLLISSFGGFFLGTGIGLGMRGGCALDGIEVMALYTLKRTGFTISEIILGLNVIIFLIAAFYLNFETALYACLTYYTVTKTIDYVVEGIEEFTGVTIISGQSEVIKEKLVLELGRGITIYKGERGYMKDNFSHKDDCDIIFTVITRLEVRRLKNVVIAIDPAAFVFTNSIKEASGGVLKRHIGH
ncbi:MAG TPA: YitT family protein [Flavobacterium sp.]|nr:YitT family protein [Flavobacterium sp.]